MNAVYSFRLRLHIFDVGGGSDSTFLVDDA
jgi:hypothetical protein